MVSGNSCFEAASDPAKTRRAIDAKSAAEETTRRFEDPGRATPVTLGGVSHGVACQRSSTLKEGLRL